MSNKAAPEVGSFILFLKKEIVGQASLPVIDARALRSRHQPNA